MKKSEEMEIVFNSEKYKFSAQIDGNELFLIMESKETKNVYLQHFSYENLVDISEGFSAKKDLNGCKELINKFIKKKNME